MGLTDSVNELCVAVDGVDWNAEETERCRRALHSFGKQASVQELDAALARIVERLDRGTVDDADGAAYAAISGGALVEFGADPGPLAEVLVARLPEVLRRARRFADRCLPRGRDPSDAWAEVEEEDLIAEVDGLPIDRATFRREPWSVGRPFAALESSVEVDRVLSAAERAEQIEAVLSAAE